jgi:uncharacterized protein YjgD (DUF1641 family)
MTVTETAPTLEEKIDLLAARVDYLVTETERQAELLDMVSELVEDAAPLARDAMSQVVGGLAEAEAKGYLASIREIAQPELLELLGNMVEAMRQEQKYVAAESEEPPSLLSLAKQLRDPDVRRGMGRALHTLRTVSVETTAH